MSKQTRDFMHPDKWKDKFNKDNVVHLYCTNREVAERNIHCIKSVNNPIVQINAEHTGKGSIASSNQSNGLEKRVYLCIDAKIVLTKNLLQTAGLCNGTTGIVKDIIFDDEKNAPGLCSCVVVDFGSSYTGESFFENDETKKGWVPIFPSTVEWDTVANDTRVSHSRTMIPLRLSYAFTIWKSQGQTFRDKIVISLTDKEKEHGLTYTAFSRVTRSSDIGISGGFYRKRLTDEVANQKLMKDRLLEERKLKNYTIKETLRYLNNMDPIPYYQG